MQFDLPVNISVLSALSWFIQISLFKIKIYDYITFPFPFLSSPKSLLSNSFMHPHLNSQTYNLVSLFVVVTYMYYVLAQTYKYKWVSVLFVCYGKQSNRESIFLPAKHYLQNWLSVKAIA